MKNRAYKFGIDFAVIPVAISSYSKLDNFQKNQQKQKLKGHFEVFNIGDYWTEFYEELNNSSKDFNLLLVELAQIVKIRLEVSEGKNDKTALFFYGAFLVTTIDLMMDAILTGFSKETMSELAYPFFNTAIETSKSLNIKYPNYNNEEFINSETSEMKKSLKQWLVDFEDASFMTLTKKERLGGAFRAGLRKVPYVGEAIDFLLFGKKIKSRI